MNDPMYFKTPLRRLIQVTRLSAASITISTGPNMSFLAGMDAVDLTKEVILATLAGAEIVLRPSTVTAGKREEDLVKAPDSVAAIAEAAASNVEHAPGPPDAEFAQPPHHEDVPPLSRNASEGEEERVPPSGGTFSPPIPAT